MRFFFSVALLLAGRLAAQEIQAVPAVSGIALPTDIQNAGDGSGRLFLVQQNGIVRIFRNGSLAPQPFLDIGAKTHAGGEQGLLGLAFPPGFSQSRRFYVDYTDLNGNTVIAQYLVSANPDAADAASETALLHITQPFANHNGGQLRFGPDGYLYIGMGDGGSAGDPFANGQNLGTLLGKILRVDVESQPGQVKIPPDNPLASAAGARPEIWAYGLRNPWRFSFDRADGDLYIADVGQDAYEEVDYQPAGGGGGQNYGWNIMEGMHCFAQANCHMQGLTLPVTEYTHADGCSISGGFVYRGRVSPGLRGTYLYGDYCSGKIWGLERQGSWSSRLLLASGFAITTFGEDESGELYVADAKSGTVYHIVGSQAPRFTAAGVVNAADFAPGLVAGSAATVFAAGVLDYPGVVAAGAVPVPPSLQGVSVTVNGIAAPVLALADRNGVEQVNFQTPFEIEGQPSASVVVARAGHASAAVAVPVLSAQPAIFTFGGSLAVAVHNADYSLVTSARPLARGEYAFAYASGLGPVSNQPADGVGAPTEVLAAAHADVRVTLAGEPCEVEFAGLAPGLVGVYQVNSRVTADAPAGVQDLVISAGAEAGPAAKVSVQ